MRLGSRSRAGAYPDPADEVRSARVWGWEARRSAVGWAGCLNPVSDVDERVSRAAGAWMRAAAFLLMSPPYPSPAITTGGQEKALPDGTLGAATASGSTQIGFLAYVGWTLAPRNRQSADTSATSGLGPIDNPLH
ncbi:hypothetical protein NORO109296_19670 [Nocardiopsis rhodophaea]